MSSAVPAARRIVIAPTAVRYIKLGQHGEWEAACLAAGILRLGQEIGQRDRLLRCLAGDWAGVTASLLAAGKDQGTATRFTNECRYFCEDDGSLLWVTFIGESLYWGFADGPPTLHEGGDSLIRRVRGGWSCTDRAGEPLTKDRLSGALVKLAAYRGTTCSVDVADYVIRRINGEKLPAVEDAIQAVQAMRTATLALIRLLTPQDFELLVDLVFTSSGWRRVGALGRAQKTLDLDLMLPSTGERAFVQVKSRTSQAQLQDYVMRFEELGSTHGRMFYVFHTGEVASDDPRVTLMGPDILPGLVIDAGLTTWLIEKTS